MTFWQKAKKPLYVLAPMANVTDAAFRRIIAKYGKPDVTWTEFVSADGLCSPGKKKLLVDLRFTPGERPVVAQLFTGHPDVMKKAAALVAKIGFDGLDINMGCPDRSVEKQGGGAAHMKDAKNAIAVIEAARKGAPKLPVSVKTRIGYNKVDLGWLRTILALKLPALTVHLRTRKEMSDVPAHWELMPEIVKLRDEVSPETLIIGNGDVVSMSDAAQKVEKYSCDGVMIGRGIFGTPWFFEGLTGRTEVSTRYIKSDITVQTKTPAERLKIMLEHAKLFEKEFGGPDGKRLKNFAVMKKHLKAYVSGWDGAKELRVQLMETNTAKEVAAIVRAYLKRSA